MIYEAQNEGRKDEWMKSQELLCSIEKEKKKNDKLIYSHLFYILTWENLLFLSFMVKYWDHLET